MATVTRLDPPVWLLTPYGEAEAEFLVDRGPEHHVQWICWMVDNGECWTFQNPQVRRITNMTMGRDSVSPFDPADVKRFKRFK